MEIRGENKMCITYENFICFASGLSIVIFTVAVGIYIWMCKIIRRQLND